MSDKIQKQSFFHEINSTIDCIPIVLIDKSGSTSTIFDKNINILSKEVEICVKTMQQHEITKCYLAYWASGYKIVSNEPVDVDKILSIEINAGGATYLDKILENIPIEWMQTNTHMFVITDGEINGNNENAGKLLKKHIDNGMNVHIITVEANNTNYIKNDCYAGNMIYKTIKDNCLTKSINDYVCYNRYHENGYYNFYNAKVVDGYFSFGKYYIILNDFSKLIEYLYGLDKRNMEDELLLRLIYDVSATINNLSKGNKQDIKYYVSIFGSIFNGTKYGEMIYAMILDEMEEMRLGKANTFQEYRNKKVNKMEQVQTLLYTDVLKSITNIKNDKYVSLPVLDVDNKSNIIITTKDKLTSTVNIRNQSFINGGIEFDHHVIPCIPYDILIDNKLSNNCLSRWMMINYGNKYPKYTGESCMYIILSDIFMIYLSDNIKRDIKNTYIQLARIILNEEKDGYNKSYYEYFLDGKMPLLGYGGEYVMNNMLQKCMKHIGLENTRSYTFWYGLLGMFEDIKLLMSQHTFCEEDLIENNLDENIHLVLDHIKLNIKDNYKQYDDTNTINTIVNENHEICENVKCPNVNVASGETCKICYKTVIYEQEIRQEEEIKNIKLFDMAYVKMDVKLVHIDESMYKNILDDEMIKMDDLDFSTEAYKFDKPTIIDTLNNRQITMTKSHEFKFMAELRYPFLKDLDMSNVVLGGGFPRSILLKNKMKDFDFFFYGLEDPRSRFKKLVHDLMDKIVVQFKNIKFMIIFKPLFNVFEMVCINDPNDFIKDNFTLEHFDKYKFLSLNKFDKFTVIDPTKKQVMSNNRKFLQKNRLLTESAISNYFEDGDKSGISMIHRFQFIMCKYGSMLDIMNNFDLPASRVAYDGENVYFTKSSHFAYKYMVNIVNEKAYSSLYNERLSKYFSYGFAVMMPELDISKLVNNKLDVNGLKWDIYDINENYIIVSHDSNLKDKIVSNNKLVSKCEKQGISLYKSSLNCSLVSLCRYVYVNDIGYKFVKNRIDMDDNYVVQFQDKTSELTFVDKIQARVIDYDFYKNKRLGGELDKKNIVSFVKSLENMDASKVYLLNIGTNANSYSLACKNVQYDSVEFSGKKAKFVAKEWMENNVEYKILTQILHPVKNTRRFIPFKSWQDCFDRHNNVPYNERYIYEIIDSTKPCKPYLDIEWTVDDTKANDIITEHNNFLKMLTDDIIKTFNTRYHYTITNENIMITSANKENKISYHIVINAKDNNGKQIVYRTNKMAFNNSAYDLYYALKTLNTYYENKIDGKVYTLDREFRTIYSNKDNSTNRPFLPLSNDNVVITDYLVTHVNDNYVLLDTPTIKLDKSYRAKKEVFSLIK